MQAPLYVVGKWWKRRDYEVVDGVLQGARRGVVEEYDPWGLYRAVEGQYRTVETPYRPYLELGRALETVSGADAQHLITGWCNKFGLLGVLPAMAQQITLPPYLLEEGHVTIEGQERRQVCQTRQMRIAGTWHGTRYSVAAPTGEARMSEEIVPQDWPKPGVQFYSWQVDAWDFRPVTFIREFFPGLRWEREAHRLPLPCSAAFWQVYGEPVKEFSELTVQFLHAVETVSSQQSGLPGGGEFDESLHFLNFLKGTIGIPDEFTGKPPRLRETLVSPSLLTSFAAMVLADIKAGRRVLRCQNCGAVFVSDEIRAKYCSPRCRNTAQSRRYRHSVREMSRKGRK